MSRTIIYFHVSHILDFSTP